MDGAYTEKSGYFQLKEMQARQVSRNPSSSHIINADVWKFIWKIPVLPKIRNFF